jgi:flagellar basal-body rod modification protein FlgD
MAVAPVSATSGSSSAFGLDFQSLLQIILQQLTYQDPLKPVDNAEFISQLAQFSQLEQTQTLNTSVNSLLASQASAQAVGLLGHTVDVTTSSNSTLSGTVQAIAFSGGQPSVTIKTTDGQTIANLSITDISQVR